MQRNDPRASPAAQEQDLTAAFTEPSGDLPDAAVLPAGVIPVPSPPGKDGRVCRCLVYCLHSPHCREGRQGHRGYLGEEPGQSRGAACDVLLEAWRKPLSRQIFTPVGFLRVAEPTQSRDRDVPAVAGWSHSGSACKEAMQGAPLQVLCPPQRLFQSGISSTGHEQDTPVLRHALPGQTLLTDFLFPRASPLS